MSSITTKFKTVYVPVVRDLSNIIIDNSLECSSIEEAIEEAKDILTNYILTYNAYYSATIEIKIVPIYE